MNGPSSRLESGWLRLCGLLLLAVALRGAALGAAWPRLDLDPDGYRHLARSLMEYGTFGFVVEREGVQKLIPTAYRPPLYPLLLAAAGWSRGVDAASVAAVHLLLGVGTVLLVYVLGLSWQGPRVAVTAAALVAVDPILLNQSSLVMTETLATFLAVVAWLLLSRCRGRDETGAAASQQPTVVDTRVQRVSGEVWQMAAAGGGLGLAALCRATFLIWLGLVVLALAWGAFARRRWSGWLALCLAAAAVLAPWGLRNALVFQRPILTSTHGGYTLWLANNADFYRFLREGGPSPVWDSRELDAWHNRVRIQTGDDELAADRWAREQALRCIRDDPGMFVRSSLVRAGWLWGLVPHRLTADESQLRQLARYAVGLWYAAVFGFALGGAFLLRARLLRAPWIWGLLLCLSFTAVHSVYWSNMRMRAPLMPVICMLAAVSLVALAQRLGRPARSGQTREGLL